MIRAFQGPLLPISRQTLGAVYEIKHTVDYKKSRTDKGSNQKSEGLYQRERERNVVIFHQHISTGDNLNLLTWIIGHLSKLGQINCSFILLTKIFYIVELCKKLAHNLYQLYSARIPSNIHLKSALI